MTQLPDSFSPQLLFLDADRNTLIRRYSDTRRLHPLSSKTCRWKAPSTKRAICLNRCARGLT